MTAAAKLEGRTAIVTGASSGIGQAVAERLGALGAHVHLIGRTQAPMEESAAAIEAAGGTATVEVLDVRSTAAFGDSVAGVAERTGGLHVMVNNAGLGYPSGIVDGDPEEWREMFDVNVLAVAVGCQAAVRAMRATASQGHIVNISSAAALRRDSGIYGATKHAVNCINNVARGAVARIADVVEFVVTQPVEIHIEEVVIRPPRGLVI